jgi:hypothetical protein
MKTDSTRTEEIRETILELLDCADPHAMREPQLFDKLNRALVPPVGQAEFDDAIAWLNSKDFIHSRDGRLDDSVTHWLITDLGRNQLDK